MPELDTLTDQYLNYLLVEKGLSAKTLDSYGSDMAMYLSFLDNNGVKDISDADTPVILKHLIAMRDAGLGARSRARHLVTIRGFYRFMVQEIDLPKSGLKLPDVLSVEEVRLLLSIPDTKTPTGSRDAAMIELLYAAGLRVSELINLKLQAVNMEAGFVRVFGKGSKERIVPIGFFAKEKIDDYLKTARPLILKSIASRYLFVARAGKPMTRQGFWKLLKR